MATSVHDAEARLAVPPHPGGFSSSELFGVPDTAASMLTTAIESGTPLAAAARIQKRGSIRINRWLPFRASQVIAPGQGFVWVARVVGLIEGHDLFIDGAGEMEWKLVRLLTVARGAGTDVSRSAAGREAAKRSGCQPRSFHGSVWTGRRALAAKPWRECQRRLRLST